MNTNLIRAAVVAVAAVPALAIVAAGPAAASTGAEVVGRERVKVTMTSDCTAPAHFTVTVSENTLPTPMKKDFTVPAGQTQSQVLSLPAGKGHVQMVALCPGRAPQTVVDNDMIVQAGTPMLDALDNAVKGTPMSGMITDPTLR